MKRHAVATAALVALVATLPGALSAQAGPPRAGTSLRVVAGAGGAFAGSQPGFDRSTGSALFAGIELAQPWRAGLAGRFGLRLEGGVASQKLSSSSGLVSGDVQTVHGAALASFALTQRGAFDSYVLAGPMWSRPSTRLVLQAGSAQMPGANFEQTTHETAPGVLLGIGAGWRLHSTTLRVEARWISLATTDKSTTMVPVVVSIAVPLHR